MPIRFKCDNCGKKLKAHDDQGGSEVLCSGCGQTLRVPNELAAAVSPAGVGPPAASTTPVPPRQPVALPLAASMPAQDVPESPLVLGKRTPMDDELDMTPMIDMTFLLLIFFMVTASFALQKSIPMPPPDVAESASQSRVPEEPEEEDDYVQVQIKSDDTIWVGSSVAPSRQELISMLKQAREGNGTDGGQRNMMVMASDDCHHEVLVMVMDAGTAAKMEKIRLAPGGDDDPNRRRDRFGRIQANPDIVVERLQGLFQASRLAHKSDGQIDAPVQRGRPAPLPKCPAAPRAILGGRNDVVNAGPGPHRDGSHAVDRRGDGQAYVALRG